MIKQTSIELEARAVHDAAEAERMQAAATELEAYAERFDIVSGKIAETQNLLRNRANQLSNASKMKLNLARWAKNQESVHDGKNECAKMRKVGDPYEVWVSADGWRWEVLKKWQVNDDKEYARWFCNVVSPMCPDGEMGDVYVADIKRYARKMENEDIDPDPSTLYPDDYYQREGGDDLDLIERI